MLAKVLGLALIFWGMWYVWRYTQEEDWAFWLIALVVGVMGAAWVAGGR